MCEFYLVSVAQSPRTGHHLAFRVRGNCVTLFEMYPARARHPRDWTRVPSARFRYDPQQQVWIAYRADAGGCWRACDGVQPSAGLASLLAKVYAD